MTKNEINSLKPPRLAVKVLKAVLPSLTCKSVLGDYEEVFHRLISEKGTFQARLWYWLEVLRSAIPFLINSVYWRTIMLKNYFKVAWRNIKKNKSFSFINISGLTIGLTCVFLIMFWVKNELDYDSFHQHKNEIYRLTSKMHLNDRDNFIASTPGKWGEFLKNEFPGIRDFVRIRHRKQNLFEYKETKLVEKGGIYADPALLDIFTFPLVSKENKHLLKDPSDMLITRSLADKYFSDADPMGKTVKFAGRPYIIRGILKNIPLNSHLQFDFVCSMSGFDQRNIDWYSDWFTTYLLADKVISTDSAASMNQGLIKKVPMFKAYNFRLNFQPFKEIYLKSSHLNGNEGNFGDINYVIIFTIVAFMVLIIAAVNYINITTAFSEKKILGIGIFKTFGATGRKLFTQFMTESLVLVSVSTFIALILVVLLLPVFNQLTGKQLVLNFLNLNTFLIIIGSGLVIGLFAGSYPAVYLSSFSPVRALRKNLSDKRPGKARVRKTLVVFQFVIAIFIICCTVGVFSQLHHMLNKDLGFDKDNVIVISVRKNIGRIYPALKNRLRAIPQVTGVSAKSSPLTDDNNGGTIRRRNQPQEGAPLMRHAAVADDYFSLLAVPVLQGTTFSRYSGQGEISDCLVNQKVVQLLNLKNPIGEIIINNHGREQRIIGVVANANFYSLKGDAQPRLFSLISPDKISRVLVKIKGENIRGTLDQIKGIFNQLVPGYPFEYQFLDDTYARLYEKEKRLGTLLNYFSVLAIFISCLGLFGLVSYTAERKKKEIGIRKTLGASILKVVRMILKDFVYCIMISFAVACPLAYYVMNQWLAGFSNRITPGLVIFIFSGLLVLVLALITVLYKSLKAASANPIDSLRYE